jgi:hypothetical protein
MGGFFDRMSRSWEFAKISYSILWDFKSLLIFPIISSVAALMVIASFVLPLWGTGTLDHWLATSSGESAEQASQADQIVMWATLFAFYFCNYFVIVFFNCGLTACAMKVVHGEAPTVGYGLNAAVKRLGPILAWAFVSALIGVLLRAIENANEKAGRFIAAILGAAWTALTYFVIPVLVMENLGPVDAFKRSVSVLKKTWGEAVMGNFSLGFLGFLVMLPVYFVLVVLGFLTAGNPAMLYTVIGVGIVLLVLTAAANSAADVIFKALLYNYATDQPLPEFVDTDSFDRAFAAKE